MTTTPQDPSDNPDVPDVPNDPDVDPNAPVEPADEPADFGGPGQDVGGHVQPPLDDTDHLHS